MKSLLRFGITASLIGTTVLGSIFGQTLKALALPLEAILQKLGPIPVFTVADQDGAPLVAAGDDNSKVAGVFISQEDANEFIERLKQENPDLGSQVRVVPVSLGEIYQLSQESANQPDGIRFAYVPTDEQVEKAREILSQNGQEYEGGVPLFVARAGEEQGYLTIERNEQQAIPFFFEKEQLQEMLTLFEQEQPELAPTIKVEVVSLEGMLSILESSEDEALQRIIFIPTTESQEFIRSTMPPPADVQE